MSTAKNPPEYTDHWCGTVEDEDVDEEIKQQQDHQGEDDVDDTEENKEEEEDDDDDDEEDYDRYIPDNIDLKSDITFTFNFNFFPNYLAITGMIIMGVALVGQYYYLTHDLCSAK